jgi:bacteriocin-like protein
MADWTEDELNQVVGEVLRRTSIDPEFRALALNEPIAAMGKVASKPLPVNLGVQFHDNSGDIKHITLPDPIPGIEELSEEELQAVAGGSISVTVKWSR